MDKKIVPSFITVKRSYLEVFHLSKLLVPGVQIQIQMYLNPPEVWSMKHGGGRTIRNLTSDDISIKLFLNQKKVEPSVYSRLMTYFKGPRKATYPQSGARSELTTMPMTKRVFEAHNSFHNQLPNRVRVSDGRQWKRDQVPFLIQDI